MVMESGFSDSTNPLLVVGSSLVFEIVKPLYKEWQGPYEHIAEIFEEGVESRPSC